MSPRPKSTWPILTLADAESVLTLLRGLGFEETAIIRDGETVVHGEMIWPEGGGVMFGSAGRNDGPFASLPPGKAFTYVVTDDPDEVHARALEHGAAVIMALTDHDNGAREFAIKDADGNTWSFGTYRGA